MRTVFIALTTLVCLACTTPPADRGPGNDANADEDPPPPDGTVEGRWVQRVPDFRVLHPALAFDPVRNALVALSFTFDAEADNPFHGTLWALQDDGWQFVSDLPSTVEDAAMVWDDARQVLLVVMRTENPVRIMETWTLSGTTWTQVANQGPEPRVRFRLVAEPGTRDVILAGGESVGLETGAWAWDGQRWSPRTAEFPGGEQDLTLVADDVGVLAITGRGTIHRLGSSAWTDVGAVPFTEPNAAAFDPGLGKVQIFESETAAALDPQTSETLPPVALDVRVLAAGYDPTVDAVRALGLDEDGQWLITVDPTLERWQFGLGRVTAMAGAFDENLEAVLVYGGTSDGDTSPDLQLGGVWSWDGQRFTAQPAGPPPSSSATMAFDQTSRRMVVLTGRGAQQPQTWEFDGTTWTQRFPAFGPETVGNAAMVWVASEGRILLVDGAGRETTSWWSGSDWEPGPPLPTGVQDPVVAVDPGSDDILLVTSTGDAFRFADGQWRAEPGVMPGTAFSGPDGVLLVEVRAGTTTSGWTAAGGRVAGEPASEVVPDKALGVWDPIRERLSIFGGVRYRPQAEPTAEVWEWVR